MYTNVALFLYSFKLILQTSEIEGGSLVCLTKVTPNGWQPKDLLSDKLFVGSSLLFVCLVLSDSNVIIRFGLRSGYLVIADLMRRPGR
jgi:hypothetical protein